MLSKKGHEDKRDMMRTGQVIYMDVAITKNNKSLMGKKTKKIQILKSKMTMSSIWGKSKGKGRHKHRLQRTRVFEGKERNNLKGAKRLNLHFGPNVW